MRWWWRGAHVREKTAKDYLNVVRRATVHLVVPGDSNSTRCMAWVRRGRRYVVLKKT